MELIFDYIIWFMLTRSVSKFVKFSNRKWAEGGIICFLDFWGQICFARRALHTFHTTEGISEIFSYF